MADLEPPVDDEIEEVHDVKVRFEVPSPAPGVPRGLADLKQEVEAMAFLRVSTVGAMRGALSDVPQVGDRPDDGRRALDGRLLDRVDVQPVRALFGARVVVEHPDPDLGALLLHSSRAASDPAELEGLAMKVLLLEVDLAGLPRDLEFQQAISSSENAASNGERRAATATRHDMERPNVTRFPSVQPLVRGCLSVRSGPRVDVIRFRSGGGRARRATRDHGAEQVRDRCTRSRDPLGEASGFLRGDAERDRFRGGFSRTASS
jgi:hypothetical protein